MIFNSFQFLIFFPVVALIYYLVGGKFRGNVWLLLASYYFYMSMKPIYGLLLLGSTFITYFCALYLSKNKGNKHKQKVSITVTLLCVFGLLFVFKYYNFVNEAIGSLFSLVGLQWHVSYLNILLPVGISFYTFQVAGYIIDVYRGKIEAERNFITYALFAAIKSLCIKYDLIFIDDSQLEGFVGDPSKAYDSSHLNSEAAAEFTKILINQLRIESCF